MPVKVGMILYATGAGQGGVKAALILSAAAPEGRMHVKTRLVASKDNNLCMYSLKGG